MGCGVKFPHRFRFNYQMLLFGLLSLCTSTFRPDHAVSLSVVAQWYGVPVLEQILFFLTDYSELSSSLYLKEILTNFDKIENEKYLMEQVHNYIPQDSFNLLKAQIEVGFFLPRAELYRETARNIMGSLYPDLFTAGEPNEFNVPYLHSDTEKFSFDLSFSGAENVFIYANLHNKTVAKFVLDLIENEVPFVLRPTAHTSKFGTPLRGFGIEMRPFRYSMEYGVKDDIVLDSAKQQTINVKDETIKMVDGVPQSYVDIQQSEDFGAKFAQYIANNLNESTNLIGLLRDISANYPLFLQAINETETDGEEFEKIPKLMDPEQSLSILNGRLFPITNLDIFTLLDTINEENTVQSVLTSHFKIPEHTIRKLMTLKLQNDQSYLLDTRSPYIAYYNDIEKDEVYESWSSSIDEFMQVNTQPTFRKNLFDIVHYTDPTTMGGLSRFYSLSYLAEEMYPCRIGLAPHFNLGNRLSRKVAFAYAHLFRESPKLAAKFLVNTISYSGIDSETYSLMPIFEQHFKASYQEMIKDHPNLLQWEQLINIWDETSPEYQLIQKFNQYVIDAGIEMDSVFLNGIPVSLQTGLQGVIYEMRRMHRTIRTLIMRQQYTSFDQFEVFDLLQDAFLVVPSLDSTILRENPQGLKLMHQSFAHQIEYIEFLSNMQWNYTDEGRLNSYYILWSNDAEEIATFTQYAQEKHNLNTTFAINPPLSKTLRSTLGISENRTALLANGRLFDSFNPNQLKLMNQWHKYFIYNELDYIISSLKYKKTEAFFYMSSIVIDWKSELITRRYIDENIWDYNASLVQCEKKSLINWDIIANPFTRQFQRIANLIKYVSDNDIVNVRLIANVPPSLKEPIFTYYRNALSQDKAIFTMLNDTTTYSVMPDMPDSWIFESMKASVDLDNILLKELNPSIHIGEYVLTNIKADGTALDDNGYFAEGAELALLDRNNVRKADTIVMLSSGYWQLAANPGVWKIELGGKRSRMIYSMQTDKLIIDSFAKRSNLLSLKVNPGMKGLQVYNISITDTSNATRVDVFSVASGHLYERLLKIMMLAVRRQSQHEVHFWIIKQFLSPQFKATLPIMSKKYNFSYHLVSYKWPTWLRPQYEKQRIIWGNKILFLDTLFPLDLERVIYIDSDQIVRTDLIELMRMDFGEAPYAFTPFCDNKKDTEPFRFWKQGYWLNHLRGKPYHISALFAIDLRKFRQMHAGDTLRYFYQQLSADPGSLANLDQDLPNYAQDVLPIYSLPQNWLWCETWCTVETMDDAKTIDLCNNPLTKKPKLYVAQNMVREWPGLDAEVRNISAGPDEYVKFFFKDN